MSLYARPEQDTATTFYNTQTPYQQHGHAHSYSAHSVHDDLKMPMHVVPQDGPLHNGRLHQVDQLPMVGQTRCYWALLSSSLHFLVLDPVLAFHLQEQAPRIIDTSLLDFVHPEEQASARHDLGSVLEDRTLHGSVTRVRYSRLSRVRRLLGHEPSASSPAYPASFPAERIAIDANYMAVDVVINWVADGLVLCFIHAVVDIMPQEDNDETRKTGWSNWCSTYGFDNDQALAMYQRLHEALAPPEVPRRSQDASLRVFQILRNQSDRHLLLTWPPYPAEHYHLSPSGEELARLALHVQIGGVSGGASSEAKTSCTRRYKSHQALPMSTSEGGKNVDVESIFIPHGTIIFACHRLDGLYGVPQSSSSNGFGGPTEQQLTYQQQYSTSQTRDGYYQTSDPSYGQQHYLPHQPMPPHISSSTYVQQWVDGQSHNHQYAQQWVGHPQTQSQASSPRTSSGPHSRTGSGSTSVTMYQHNWPSQSPPYVHPPLAGESSNAGYVRTQSPVYQILDPCNSVVASAASPTATATAGGDSVGGSTEGGSPTSAPEPQRQGRRSPIASGIGTGSSREQYGSGGRSAGNPPVGISRCASCKVTHSPEWRKGPSGKKDLCNACGLRYARSRAKKDGIQARKRKDKVGSTQRTSSLANAASDVASDRSPTASHATPHSHRRVDYDESPNAYLSASSLNGSSAEESVINSFPVQTQSNVRNQAVSFPSLTPSPSPPSSAHTQSFSYPPNSVRIQDQTRLSQQAFTSTAAYYAVPSALSTHAQQAQADSQHAYYAHPSSDLSTSPTAVVSQLSGRVASMHAIAPSYERNRGRDRESTKTREYARDRERMLPMPLPPTPVSAESRYDAAKPMSSLVDDSRRSREKVDSTW